MATKMANQVDLTPATTPGIHFHAPNGHSASEFNNPSDAPSAAASANVAKAVTAKIAQANGGPRFANPA